MTPTPAEDHVDIGNLKVRVNSALDALPINDASVQISYTADPDTTLEQITTNTVGQTESVTLKTPPLEYSMEPSESQPYSEYTIRVSAPNFETVTIAGSQLLPTTNSIQNVVLKPLALDGNPIDVSVIGAHTLYGDYPPKIAEAEIKPINETGEIVLSSVVIPEYIVVHDGSVSDSTASNYYVRYQDYIKNVASCEIYATWSENTIIANVLAIMSFTMNRVYTEWYRNKGYNFTITSSTAQDHKWIKDKNIYDNIDRVVDSIFTNYLSRPNIKQPILTQYCDGQRVTCPNWMTQWGSKRLGDQGLTPIQILRYYYGENMFINTTNQVSGVPSSWPGQDLTIGSSSESVRIIQDQLNRISQAYPLIPKVAVDGIYGQDTANSVKVFQEIFNLPATGIVDYPTWYKISGIYVAVTRIAELN